jgi:anthranilate/para-aminobenzoate synthase component I
VSETHEIQVETIDDLGMDAITAFAKLRSYTPGRGAYLLESLSPDGDAGRYSMVGYRVLQADVIPPGVDPVSLQQEAMASQPQPESFAAALALGCVGYVSDGVAKHRCGVRMSDDEPAAGQFLVGATVMLFDHLEGTVTVAGKKKGNLVPRCIWEAQHGPDMEPLATPASDAEPKGLATAMSDDRFAAKAVRAKPFLGDELTRLTLAHTYYAPLAGSDPFDVYRAWRALAAADKRGAFGYYIDMGESPVTPPMHVMGIADEVLFLKRRDQAEAAGDAVAAVTQALPHAGTTGEPPLVAAKLIRRVEDASRHLWGGAVGYFCPGGEAQLLFADRVITAQSGSYWHTTGADLCEDTDPLEAPALARRAASSGLGAIACAQAS